MGWRKLAVCVTTMSLATPLAACGAAESGEEAQNGGPVKVGAIFPLSGPAGNDGKRAVAALEVMAGIINDAGGVSGRKIEIVPKDDKGEPAVGVSRANELVRENVSAVIEGFSSPVTLAVQPVLQRAGITDITMGSKADEVLEGSVKDAVRLNTSNAMDGEAIAELLVNRVQAKRVAYLAENDVYGNGAVAQIKLSIERLGGQIQEVALTKFPLEETDFRVALGNVGRAQPDAVVIVNAAASAGLPALIEQYDRAGIDAQLVAAAGTVTPPVVKLAGEAANGLVSTDVYFAEQEPFSSIEANNEFVKRYEKAEGAVPDKVPALAAASLQTWAAAAERADSLERSTVVEEIRGSTVPDTVFGDLAFDERGQAQLRSIGYEVSAGEVRVLR